MKKWGDSWCRFREEGSFVQCHSASLSSYPRLQTCYSICSAHAWMCSLLPTLVTKGRSHCLQHLSVSTCDWPVPWNILPPHCSVECQQQEWPFFSLFTSVCEQRNVQAVAYLQNSSLLSWWHGNTVVAGVSGAASWDSFRSDITRVTHSFATLKHQHM